MAAPASNPVYGPRQPSRFQRRGKITASSALNYHFHRRPGVSIEQAMSRRGKLLKAGSALVSAGKKPRYASLGHDVPVVEVKVHFEAPVPRKGHVGETISLKGVSFRKGDYEMLHARLQRAGYGLVLPEWGKKGPTRPVVIKKTKRPKLTEYEIGLLGKLGIPSDHIPKKMKYFPFTRDDLTQLLVSLNIKEIAQNRGIIRRLMSFEMAASDVQKLDGVLRAWSTYVTKSDPKPSPTA